MSSPTSLKKVKKVIQFHAKVRILTFFDSSFKIQNLNVQAKIRKILSWFPGGSCWDHFVKF